MLKILSSFRILARSSKLSWLVFSVFFFGLIIFLALSASSDTDSPAVVSSKNELASRNSARILSQENNNFRIKLNFSSKNEAAQSVVRYYVSLYKANDQGKIIGFSPIDIALYEEIVILEKSGSSAEKEIRYSAPEYLSGKYNLVVEYANEAGASVDSIDLGNIELSGNQNDFLEIFPETCFLHIAKESNQPKYDLMQGVDVESHEDLIVTCLAENHFTKNISVTPRFVHYRRKNFYPEKKVFQENKNFPPTLFSAKEKKLVSFSIPKAVNPQTYDASLVLQDKNGYAISTKIFIHYVVVGESATFRDILLDKIAYAPGETAEITILSSGSADNFENSRHGGTKNPTLIGEIDILNNRNLSCLSEKMIIDLTNAAVLGTKVELPIKNDCPDPHITATLKGYQEKILDEKTFLKKE